MYLCDGRQAFGRICERDTPGRKSKVQRTMSSLLDLAKLVTDSSSSRQEGISETGILHPQSEGKQSRPGPIDSWPQ
jgi:hypothetical protein